MVQEATPITNDEVTSSLESLTPDSQVEADAPLIAPEPMPDDAPEGEGLLIQPESEATESADEGAASESAETKATSETESEPDAAPEGYVSNNEVNKIRSGMDRQISQLNKQLEDMRAQQASREAEYQQQLSAQNYAAQVSAYQSQLAQQYVDQGYSEQDASRIAGEQTRQMETAYRYALENQKLQEQLKARTQSEESTNARIAARDLAIEHGVSTDDVPLLLAAKSPEDMTALAQRLGALNKQVSERQAARRSEIPAGSNADMDTGGGGDPPMTDAQKWNAYGSGTLDLDMQEAQRIGRKLGYL